MVSGYSFVCSFLPFSFVDSLRVDIAPAVLVVYAVLSLLLPACFSPFFSFRSRLLCLRHPHMHTHRSTTLFSPLLLPLSLLTVSSSHSPSSPNHQYYYTLPPSLPPSLLQASKWPCNGSFLLHLPFSPLSLFFILFSRPHKTTTTPPKWPCNGRCRW